MAHTRKAHRADDKRGPGMGDNVKNTVSDSDGAGPRLADIFNDRSKGRNGKAKRSVK